MPCGYLKNLTNANLSQKCKRGSNSHASKHHHSYKSRRYNGSMRSSLKTVVGEVVSEITGKTKHKPCQSNSRYYINKPVKKERFRK